MENKCYTFTYIPDKVCKTLRDKSTSDLLMKWSMKGNLKVQYYSFNQPFHVHNKEDFVNSFFSDINVYSTLVVKHAAIGKPASSVKFEIIPCTMLSMEFFDRLLDPENNIVRCDENSIVQCIEDEVHGFIVDDNLKNVILNQESQYYKLYSESERKQFLWKLFCHLCLGGEWCQYEFSIKPYLDTVKSLYKDIVSVERIENSSELVIRSIVLKVQAYDEDCKLFVPEKEYNIQDFVYLIIEPFKRSVTVVSHSYGGSLYF